MPHTDQDKFDRLDSGMTETERGTPYRMGEVEAFIEQYAKRDAFAYPCELMRFLVRRIQRLEQEKHGN